MSTQRIASLDSIRGLAALGVVLTHCTGVYSDPPAWVTHLPLSLVLWSGHGFVLVFFALSGFVLFIPFKRGNVAYAPYLVKRVARLYPPFVVAVLLSAALYTLVDHRPIAGLNEWFNRTSWEHAPTAKIIIGHLMMTDRRDLQDLDNVMWSLVHEMRISVVFPVIAWCVLRDWRSATAVALIVSIVGAYMTQHHPLFVMGMAPFDTLQYVFLFAAGAGLCLYSDALRVRVNRWPRWLALIALAAALALLATPFDVAVVNITLGSFAALSIVAIAASGVFDRALLRSIPVWLGRVSYSLYLIHLVVLLVLVHLFIRRMPLMAILCCTVVLSLLIAELMYRWVEKPSISAGKAFSGAFFPISAAH